MFELEELNGAVIPDVVKRHNVETLKSHKGERERGGREGLVCRATAAGFTTVPGIFPALWISAHIN